MYICPFSGLVNGTLTITDYKLHFTSVERVLLICYATPCHLQSHCLCVCVCVLTPVCARAGVSVRPGREPRGHQQTGGHQCPQPGQEHQGPGAGLQGTRESGESAATVTSRVLTCVSPPLMHQDMRSPRFAYKVEEGHPDVVELLAKHTFPLSHSLVSPQDASDHWSSSFLMTWSLWVLMGTDQLY